MDLEQFSGQDKRKHDDAEHSFGDKPQKDDSQIKIVRKNDETKLHGGYLT